LGILPTDLGKEQLHAVRRYHGDIGLVIELVGVGARCGTSAVRSEGRDVEAAVCKIC
jgi:hypothetical protein